MRNTVWLTADMHYTAAHYYDPNAAQFQDFEPFWEFVSGPLHAGTWSPGKLDNTFGPRVMYQKGCSKAQGENLAPCFGLQFFGHVAIDGATEVMTVTLKDVEDRALWSTRIEPRLEKWSGGAVVGRRLRLGACNISVIFGRRVQTPNPHMERQNMRMLPALLPLDLRWPLPAAPRMRRRSIRSTARKSWPAHVSTSRSSSPASPTRPRSR